MPGLDDFESDDQEGIVGAPVHRTRVPSPAVFIPRLFNGLADLGLSGLGIGLQDIELVRLRLGARHVRVSSNHSIPAESRPVRAAETTGCGDEPIRHSINPLHLAFADDMQSRNEV